MATKSRDPGHHAPPVDVLTVSRPQELKALAHPIRLRVLAALGEGEALTNRELAVRLEVDPGHLHFHVRMLVDAGLIEAAEREHGREKPYRAVARTVRVAPELLGSSLTSDVQAAMLDEVQRGSATHAEDGRFRSAQLTVRIAPERLPELIHELAETATSIEDAALEPIVITVFAHPATPTT